jgi:catechol-2,3-dioxygenase
MAVGEAPSLAERLTRAMNAHDIGAFVALFSEDLYVEDVEQHGAGIEAAVDRMSGAA